MSTGLYEFSIDLFLIKWYNRITATESDVMPMLERLIAGRSLPALRSREDMLDILCREVYGYIRTSDASTVFEIKRNTIPRFCAGKAVLNKITAKCLIEGREFSFPFTEALICDGKKHPFFVHINFRADVPDRYMPTEELIDNGFSVLAFCYNDITRDNADFADGLAGVLYPHDRQRPDDAGKIAMWAWAASRIMDYAVTRSDVLDLDLAVVCGHSRLGKTALLAAAEDVRFRYAYSNDSGCAGAAITREKNGETVKDIYSKFPHWFCENYRKYVDNEEKMPFDQHFLVASTAPRRVLIGSAVEDVWSDPMSEFLCAVAASPAFNNGIVCPDRLPHTGDSFLEGDVGYHLRHGQHYFSREDWHKLIEFVRIHEEKM